MLGSSTNRTRLIPSPRDARAFARFRLVFFAIFLVGITFTQGEAQWLVSNHKHYSIFFQAGFEKDVKFTRKWLDAAEKLIRTKYKVKADDYFMSVYLLPEPSDDINAGHSGNNQCCTLTSTGLKTGKIRLLTRSAEVWHRGKLRSSLGLDKSGDDYHAKVLISEYIPIGHYAVQDGRPSGGWQYYSAPEWFVQGLQEYDAIFHSTDANRTNTSQRLREWAKINRDKFACCSSGLVITDPYNGGAAFMTFLASEFGEGIHTKLLRNPARTFDLALASETRPYSAQQLYEKFLRWLGA